MVSRQISLTRVILALILLVLCFGPAQVAYAQPPVPDQPDVVPYTPDAPNASAAPDAALAPAFTGGSPVFQSLVAPADDRENSTPTGWSVLAGQTPAQVSDEIANGKRLVDISVDSAAPLKFTATFVSDSGSYDKTWWWYYGVDGATLTTLLSDNGARLIALKAYDNGAGATRFVAVMISNTGADAAGWWWYYNATVPELVDLLTTNNGRLIQVSTYTVAGVTRYAAVMVSNTGANARGWWWYVNATGTEVSTHLSDNNARLVDLDVNDNGTFNVIMTSCSGGCPLWWWYYNVSINYILPLSFQAGARIIDITTYPGCGSVCYGFVLINNSNALTSRVGELLRNGTTGTKGLYLKQVGGPVLASLMENTPFEPASTIKAAVHLYTMRKLQSGPDTVDTNITRFVPPVGSSCPTTAPNGVESINTADQLMMYRSDNTRTYELVTYFGVANINSMLDSLGMTSTQINHVIGCGGPTPNTSTLTDLGKLYEGVANASLVDATRRDLFFANTAGRAQFEAFGFDWTGLWDSDVPAMIDEEAPVGMSSAKKTWFMDQMNLGYKAGNYKLCTSAGCATYVDHISIAGYAKIPFCDGPAREYVFGTFINNSTSDATSGATFNATKSELLREQIRAGLVSCQNVTFTYAPMITR